MGQPILAAAGFQPALSNKAGSVKRLIIPLVVGLVGTAMIVILLPRTNRAAAWGLQFDRDGAIQRGRLLAESEGFQTSGCNVYVDAEHRGQLEAYQHLHREDSTARAISPVLVKVAFVSPDRGRVFRAELYPDGRVAGWTSKQKTSGGLGPYSEMLDALAVANSAFDTIAGSEAGGYHLTTNAAGTKDGSRFTWERTAASVGFQPTIDVVVFHAHAVRTQTRLNFSNEFETRLRARHQTSDWVRIAYFILYFAMMLAASVLYTLGSIQRRVDHRFAIAFSLANLVFVILAFLFGPTPDQIRMSAALDNDQAIVGFSGSGFAFVSAFGLAWVVSGAGLFMAGSTLNKWWSLRLALSRRMFSKPVGLAIAAGILWGPLIAAVPLLIAEIFPDAEWKHADVSELFGRSIVSQAIDFPLHPTVVGLFGILLAFALTRIQRVWISRVVFCCLGLIFILGFEGRFLSSPVANFLNAGLTLAASYELFRRFDLLAVITAATATTILNEAALLFLQPSAALRGCGWRLLGTAATMLGAGVVLLWKAPDAPEGEQAITGPIGEGLRSARDELKSEFSIAQRAQREMLPANPPVVPGFSLSAHCTPAKEVGGDLYDFLPLSNDRLAIAVADVSGKGVPAALYMTLTKGLLAATTQDELHLSEIMAQINGHLHSVGHRKTFVTMALAILDPVQRTIEYARAGHNPAVLRSVSTGSTRLLNSPGIGLGINSGKIFRRTLAVEKLVLESGDTLVLYSDGLTEAMNRELEEFGEDRLMAAVEKTDSLSADGARDQILRDVTDFLAGNHPQDDLTLVVLRVE